MIDSYQIWYTRLIIISNRYDYDRRLIWMMLYDNCRENCAKCLKWTVYYLLKCLYTVLTLSEFFQYFSKRSADNSVFAHRFLTDLRTTVCSQIILFSCFRKFQRRFWFEFIDFNSYPLEPFLIYQKLFKNIVHFLICG